MPGNRAPSSYGKVKFTKIMKTIRYKIKNCLYKFQNESLTVMVIPHSGNKGLSFQLNYLHFFYFLFLLVIFVTLSFYSYGLNSIFEARENNLRKIYDLDHSVIGNFNKNYKRIGASIYNIEKFGQSIYALSGQVSPRMESNLDSLFGDKSGNWFLGILNKKKVELASLKYKLTGALQVVESLRNFFSNFNHFNPDKITLYPVTNGYLVRGYDLSIPHIGLDIGAPRNTPVLAAASGRVTRAGRYGNYGLTVEIVHHDGTKTLYAHNTRFNVSVGDFVEKGSVISFVGSTGRSSGNHLHFEIRKNHKAVNPLPYVRFFIKRNRVNPEFWAKMN